MLPELRARRALTSVGLRPNIALEAVDSVNNEVWMTPEVVVVAPDPLLVPIDDAALRIKADIVDEHAVRFDARLVGQVARSRQKSPIRPLDPATRQLRESYAELVTPELLARWTAEGLFAQTMAARADGEPFAQWAARADEDLLR